MLNISFGFLMLHMFLVVAGAVNAVTACLGSVFVCFRGARRSELSGLCHQLLIRFSVQFFSPHTINELVFTSVFAKDVRRALKTKWWLCWSNKQEVGGLKCAHGVAANSRLHCSLKHVCK